MCSFLRLCLKVDSATTRKSGLQRRGVRIPPSPPLTQKNCVSGEGGFRRPLAYGLGLAIESTLVESHVLTLARGLLLVDPELHDPELAVRVHIPHDVFE